MLYCHKRTIRACEYAPVRVQAYVCMRVCNVCCQQCASAASQICDHWCCISLLSHQHSLSSHMQWYNISKKMSVFVVQEMCLFHGPMWPHICSEVLSYLSLNHVNFVFINICTEMTILYTCTCFSIHVLTHVHPCPVLSLYTSWWMLFALLFYWSSNVYETNCTSSLYKGYGC